MRAFALKDSDLVSALLDAAFAPSHIEGVLVRRLRERKKVMLEWVLDDAKGVSAHIVYTHAFRDGKIIGWHLAPVAVRPDVQRAGLGSQLIRESLAAEPLRDASVFVLGDPNYYRRFGFASVAVPVCPFDDGNPHFLALRWTPDESFVVGYEREFFKG